MGTLTFLNSRGEVRDYTGGVKAKINEDKETGSKLISQESSQYLNSMDMGKEFVNALGGEQNITTLTTILADVFKQSYYTINISDYVPMVTGDGNPWAYNLMNWKRSFTRDGIGNRIVNLGSNNAKHNSNNIQVEPLTRPVINWMEDASYNIMQLNTFSTATQKMDYIAELYGARKEIYDLDIQEISMFGNADAGVSGLLTQSTVNSNTTLITKAISSMTATEFNGIGAGMLKAYRANCYNSANPDTLIVPQSDFYDLNTQMSETYPSRTKLSVLQEVMEKTSMNPQFKILPLAYAEQTYNSAITGLNKNRYVLTRKNKGTIRMDIPLPFTVTLPNSADNFNYNSASYARFSGVNAIRELETLYFDYTP